MSLLYTAVTSDVSVLGYNLVLLEHFFKSIIVHYQVFFVFFPVVMLLPVSTLRKSFHNNIWPTLWMMKLSTLSPFHCSII